jgi:hypothetical protein
MGNEFPALVRIEYIIRYQKIMNVEIPSVFQNCYRR